MTLPLWLAGFTVLGLIAYLVHVLLNPEKY